MKKIFLDILQDLAVAAVIVIFVYLRWKSLQSRVRDLADGGVQTLFGSRKSK
ncbi:MAG: hypothetical protein WB660_07155 [Candidatus Sulfotelmatobacter sp.]